MIAYISPENLGKFKGRGNKWLPMPFIKKGVGPLIVPGSSQDLPAVSSGLHLFYFSGRRQFSAHIQRHPTAAILTRTVYF
jgi:hypothetical protein